MNLTNFHDRSGFLTLRAMHTLLPERFVSRTASLVKSSQVWTLSGEAQMSCGVVAGQPSALAIRSAFIKMMSESGPSMGTPKMAPFSESVMDAVGKNCLGWVAG